MSTEPEKPLVVVTGASGYIASHIVKQLLESNLYRVRGTVRSLSASNEKRVAPLRELSEKTGQALDLVEADLLNDESWPRAIAGADYVLHTASPFIMAPKSQEDKIIKPAVQGTLSVLKACAAPGSKVKRVVLTSSLVSMMYGQDMDARKDKPFDANDWTDVTKVDAYTKSKTLAEKAAWDFVKNIPEDGNKFDLATVNPSLVIGPPINMVQGTSAEIIKQLLCCEYPFYALLNVQLPVVDVRDVAACHVLAMTKPGAAGVRFIANGASPFMKEVSDILRKEFAPKGYNPPSYVIPRMAASIFSMINVKVSAVLPLWGKELQFDTAPAEDMLEIKWTSIDTSVIEMCNSMIAAGYVAKRN